MAPVGRRRRGGTDGPPARARLLAFGTTRTLVLLLGAVAAFCAPACSRRRDPPLPLRALGGESGLAPPRASNLIERIARAEDRRDARALPDGRRGRSDVTVRRAEARALARILDADDGPLLRSLEDEDPEVIAWSSYGLGESCKGHEERHVRALGARLAALTAAGAAGPPAVDPGALDPTRVGGRSIVAILRALGRCGSDRAEATLRPWVGSGGEEAEAACYAIGDIAARRGALSAESAGALLAAALSSPPLDAALFAFGLPGVAFAPELGPRLAAAARAALARPGDRRVFAVRALARTRAAGAASDLERILLSASAPPAERVEAAAGLALVPSTGTGALGDAVVSLAGRSPPVLSGDGFAVLLASIEDLDLDGSTAVASALESMARVRPEPGSGAAVLRRASALRCAAAAKLVRAAWDAGVLRDCDLGDGEAGEAALLAAVDRGPLILARRSEWARLARSEHVRIRETALEIVARHPELGAAGREAIAAALSSGDPGVVAAAAKVVRAQPERFFIPAPPDRSPALDTVSPAPASAPAMDLDPEVARGLRAALAWPWRPDFVQTRAALLEAGLAAGVEEGRRYARQACADDNATVRGGAARALAAAGEAPCAPRPVAGAASAPEIGHTLTRRTKVSFETDAGPLAIVFDPALAPVAVTRLVALARAGFYEGVSFHRVVPGFVVQFGDPRGDGYGGSGRLLRCETSPVGFEPLDVGVALAGRDTGSSQLFVALGRRPQLDGESAWVGRAQGDWSAVVAGDRIHSVRVEDDRAPPGP